MFVMGLSLDYPAFCLSFKRLQFSGVFFATLYARERVLFFVKNCTAFVDFFLGKKVPTHLIFFSPLFCF